MFVWLVNTVYLLWLFIRTNFWISSFDEGWTNWYAGIFFLYSGGKLEDIKLKQLWAKKKKILIFFNKKLKINKLGNFPCYICVIVKRTFG